MARPPSARCEASLPHYQRHFRSSEDRNEVFDLCAVAAITSERAQADTWQPSAGHVQVPIWPGAGSYEPASRLVVAVEPSHTMIAQRPVGAGPVVQGRTEALPFRRQRFYSQIVDLNEAPTRLHKRVRC
jgi:hypothetical protein